MWVLRYFKEGDCSLEHHCDVLVSLDLKRLGYAVVNDLNRKFLLILFFLFFLFFNSIIH